MSMSHERRALSFGDKPVIVYVSATSKWANIVLARCRGVTLRATDEALSEDQYVALIRDAVAELGFVADLQRRDDKEIVFEVRRIR